MWDSVTVSLRLEELGWLHKIYPPHYNTAGRPMGIGWAGCTQVVWKNTTLWIKIPSPHLLWVGPSVHVDDEGVALGLREVGRKIKTNLDIIGFVFGKGFQDSFNYLGLVFAAVDRNVQIGNLGEKHSTKLIDQHLGWEETFGRDLTARSEESLALSTNRLILVLGFVSYMYTCKSRVRKCKESCKGVRVPKQKDRLTWGTCGPSQLIA